MTRSNDGRAGKPMTDRRVFQAIVLYMWPDRDLHSCDRGALVIGRRLLQTNIRARKSVVRSFLFIDVTIYKQNECMFVALASSSLDAIARYSNTYYMPITTLFITSSYLYPLIICYNVMCISIIISSMTKTAKH